MCLAAWVEHEAWIGSATDAVPQATHRLCSCLFRAVWVRSCVCVCARVCVCVYVCVSMSLSMSVSASACACVCVCVPERVRARAPTHGAMSTPRALRAGMLRCGMSSTTSSTSPTPPARRACPSKSVGSPRPASGPRLGPARPHLHRLYQQRATRMGYFEYSQGLLRVLTWYCGYSRGLL